MREEEAIKQCLAKYGDNIKLRKFGGSAASMELPVPFLGFVQKAVAKVDDRGCAWTLHFISSGKNKQRKLQAASTSQAASWLIWIIRK